MTQDQENNLRTAVIGDVHGHPQALELMIRQLEAYGVDEVIQVGDLLDRGPNSQACVALMRTRGFQSRNGDRKALHALRGNHEDNHLRVRLGIPWPGETKVWNTAKYPDVYASLKAQDWAYLETLPYIYHDAKLGLTVIHGGVLPTDGDIFSMDLDDQARLTRTGHIGQNGERLKPGHCSDRFWADHYDGRYGHIVFGHTSFETVHAFPHATGVDGSKHGKLLAAVFSNSEPTIAFDVARTQ